jgi:hypothetical protein
MGCHPVAVVQYKFIYKQYTERHKTNNTKILEECGPCPIFAGFTLGFALQLRKRHAKTCQGSRRVPAGTMKIHKHTITIHRHNNKNTQITVLNRSTTYIHTLIKIEPKEYERKP